MAADFAPMPHQEAAAIIADKAVVAKSVFNKLLPEIRLRAFTVAGIESANALQRIQDAVASVPLGDQTWDEAKKQIVEDLEPYLGDGADRRADLVLRTNGFQAFSTTVHRVGMEDDDTTDFQYLHGECSVPTPSHLALNGIIVPKQDPFWDTHTGPWGHLGCVCYKRPMNPDMVEDARVEDRSKNPEDRNVIEGPALRKLNEGEILRGGVRHDIRIDGPDNSGFKWNPDDLRLPIGEILERYDPAVREKFIADAKKTMVGNTTVWSWLNGAKPVARSKAEIARQDAQTARIIAERESADAERPAPPSNPDAESPREPRPTPPAPAEVKPKTPLERITDTLRANSGASKISYSSPPIHNFGAEFPSVKKKLAHAEALAGFYADMRQRFPAMPAAPTYEVVVVDSKRGLASLDGPTPRLSTKGAEWSDASWDTIHKWEKANQRKWGTERQGSQIHDNFRHELAHNLSTPAIMEGWREIMRKYDFDWFREHVSEYAWADRKAAEALAETFGLCTRMDYVRGSLPKDLEDFIFVRMLGEPAAGDDEA